MKIAYSYQNVLLSENKMAGIIKSVMKAIYNLSDEDNYNVYDAADIAEYLGLRQEVVDKTITTLYDGGFLGECMNLHDDGIETFYLTDKAIDLVEVG
jgi:DNA-binding MarR family transcriptional regulator